MRNAVRALRKSPLLAGIAIASLGLGIGANLTVYTVVRELILEDISAQGLDRLVRVEADLRYEQYRQLQGSAAFAGLAFETGFHDTNWRRGARSEIAWQMDTSANLFDVLGVRPAMGRGYSQAEEGRLVAVVSHGFWTRRLRRDPHVLESSLQLNGQVYTVLGVLPKDYRSVMGHGVAPEIYVPARVDTRQNCHPIARLRDGLTREQARAAWTADVEHAGGAELAREASVLRPLGGFAGNASREGDAHRFYVFFVMLLGVAGVLALIACANAANLLMARGASRKREMAVRKALGASRWQTGRPIVAEAAVLVGCGCVAAIAIDALLRSRLEGLRWPNAYNVPFEFHFPADGGLLGYAVLVAFAALVITALIPARLGANVEIGLALKASDAGFGLGRGSGRLRPVSFAGLQVVLAVLLLSLGAVFARSFLHVAHGDLGFDAEHTLIAAVHPFPRHRQFQREWRERLIHRIREVPGVVSATSTGMLPLMGEADTLSVRKEGEPSAIVSDVYAMEVGEQYFATMGIQMLRGRDFTITDGGHRPAPAIVNRVLARRLFGEADPIGKRVRAGAGAEKEEMLEIVGVAADAKLRTLGEAKMATLYRPDYNGQFLVRVTGNPRQWIEPLRAALGEVDDSSAEDIRPLGDALAGALFPMQAASGFVGSLSALGLVLALVGLYGSVAHAVARRTREMGIRAALGATRSRILGTALRDGMVVVAAGMVAGLALAAAAIRPLVDLLPDGLNPWDPRVFAAVGALVLATGAAAALVPARRAAAVDPAAALREE